MLPLSLKNKAEKVIFLDLDGVIFDSYGLWDEVIEQVLSHANIPYTQAIKKQLWRLNMIEAQEYLASLFAQQNVVYQAKKVKEQLVKAYQKVLLMPHAAEFLADLSREGCVIYAVTSNYDDLAKIGLESKAVLKYFFKIYSCIEEGFADKTEAFYRFLLDKEILNGEKVIYLEDSSRNLVEAQKCGIKGIYLSNADNPQDNQGQRFYTIRCLNDFKKFVKEEKMINEMKKRSLIFVDKIYQDDFIQNMIAGNLSKEAVCHYLKADAIYLEKFADIYAQLFARIPDKAIKNFFLSQIDFIFNHEVGAHHILAEAAGRDYHDIIEDKAWYPSSDHYIKHMYYQLYQDNPSYILAAMLPCPWIYQQVAQKALASGKIADENPFKAWFEFYAGDGATSCLPTYFDLLKRYSKQLPEENKKEVIRVFLESCQHERNFFQMAVDQEEWPEEVRNV